MKMPISLQIKILKIVNVLLIVGIIFTGYLMFLEYQKTKPHILTGNLEYLKEISDPENPNVGVYLRLHLEYPKYAKFGEVGDTGFFILSNTTDRVEISLKSRNGNEKDGFIVDVEDKNSNGVIDTGDVFHIYGRSLNGYDVMFCITGVRGNIRIKISQG